MPAGLSNAEFSGRMERILENWGRWSRGGGNAPSRSSPLYRLMVENNEGGAVAVEPVAITVNYQLAWATEKAIVSCCDDAERQILVMRYVEERSDGRICREMHLYRSMMPGIMENIFQKIIAFAERMM